MHTSSMISWNEYQFHSRITYDESGINFTFGKYPKIVFFKVGVHDFTTIRYGNSNFKRLDIAVRCLGAIRQTNSSFKWRWKCLSYIIAIAAELSIWSVQRYCTWSFAVVAVIFTEKIIDEFYCLVGKCLITSSRSDGWFGADGHWHWHAPRFWRFCLREFCLGMLGRLGRRCRKGRWDTQSKEMNEECCSEYDLHVGWWIPIYIWMNAADIIVINLMCYFWARAVFEKSNSNKYVCRDLSLYYYS